MVDRRFSEEVLKAISPLGVKASLKAIDDLTAGEAAQRTTLASKLEQLESLLSKTGQGVAELWWKQRDLRVENENFQIGVYGSLTAACPNHASPRVSC
jgi:hypothetical protein